MLEDIEIFSPYELIQMLQFFYHLFIHDMGMVKKNLSHIGASLAILWPDNGIL